jgi:FKBP-type peptidyl-prolyl cis-trans isomerase SlyD
MQVGYNAVVSLRYCMKNSAGEVLEDKLHSAPVEYIHGSGNILPALEANLTGLLPGDQKRVVISNETSSQLDSSFYFDLVIDGVRPATEEELIKGVPTKLGTKDDCGPGCIC